jgi:hypothetical protein
MGVMAHGTLGVHALVSLPLQKLVPIVAIHAEFLRVGDEKEPVRGAVRTVADDAAAGGQRAMEHLAVKFQDVALEAKLFLGQHQVVASLQVAGIAELGCIRSVFPVPLPSRLRAALPAGDKLGLLLVERRNAVEEEGQYLVARLRRASDDCQSGRNDDGAQAQ